MSALRALSKIFTPVIPNGDAARPEPTSASRTARASTHLKSSGNIDAPTSPWRLPTALALSHVFLQGCAAVQQHAQTQSESPSLVIPVGLSVLLAAGVGGPTLIKLLEGLSDEKALLSAKFGAKVLAGGLATVWGATALATAF